MKKLVFATNYLNPHQVSLAEEFVKIYGNDYAFIAMTPFNIKRLKAGYRDMNNEPYVLRAYESQEAMSEARTMINEAECLMIGGIPLDIAQERMSQGKITFVYDERIFKGPFWKDAARIVKYVTHRNGVRTVRLKGDKTFLLCAGAFVAHDFRLFGFDPSRCYRWGYFTECRRYDYVNGKIPRIEAHGIKPYLRVQGQASCGREDSSHGSENLFKGAGAGILWAGRFLALKHTELAVQLADNLKRAGLAFRLKIIGSGEKHDDIVRMIDAKNLHDCVELIGALPNDELRSEMEKADIFLFTSDRHEGWGAVLNESMNAGCAVVASDRIGSVPYLVKNGQNGLIFRERDIDDLTRKVTSLLDDPQMTARLGREAYRTIADEWNAEVAAKRFVELSDALNHGQSGNIFTDGPLSPAPQMRDNWFAKMK